MHLLALVTTAALAAAPAWPTLDSVAAQGGGEHDAAVVVGIEKYSEVAPIPGAVQNADDWFAYLTRGRKVPTDRVFELRSKEATLEKLRRFAREAAAAVEPGGTLWFVFIGHGAPSADGTDGVLVGYDAQQDVDSLYARSLPQQELLGLLGAGKQARTVVVVDACFNGKSQSGEELVKGLQPLIALKAAAKKGETIVMTAGKGSEFSGPLPGVARPAFSYLVLGALRGWADDDGNGTVTAGEVVTYARGTLRTLVKDRSQTPELVSGSSDTELASGATEKGPDVVAIALAPEKERQEKARLDQERRDREQAEADRKRQEELALAEQKRRLMMNEQNLPEPFKTNFEQTRVGVCTDQSDVTQWWFCDARQGIRENDFIEQYASLTRATDLDAANSIKNPWSLGGSAAYLTLFGSWCAYSAYTGLTSGAPKGDDGFGQFLFNGGILLGCSQTLAGSIFLTMSLVFIDGQPADHDLSLQQGRIAAEKYNRALLEKTVKEAEELERARSPIGGLEVHPVLSPAFVGLDGRF